MDIQIKEFAPVIVPTLCRFEHLKRLLESLEKCKYADKTEVYLGVDYPAKNSHWPGYRKIVEYLNSRNFRFKEFHIIYRESNYGFGKNGNYSLLKKEVKKKHSRFISSEDDNEFSPNFLEYMNLNLELYEKDNDVIYISGYLSKDVPIIEKYTQFRNHVSCAWGIGSWFDKISELDSEDIYLKLINHKNIKRLTKSTSGRNCFLSLIGMSKGESPLGDVKIAAYQILEEKNTIFPTISKVRNYGWDGSGTHGGIVLGYSTQEIDTSLDYKINEAPTSFGIIMENRQEEISEGRIINRDKILINFSFYLYKLTGVYWNHKKFKKKLKKLFQLN